MFSLRSTEYHVPLRYASSLPFPTSTPTKTIGLSKNQSIEQNLKKYNFDHNLHFEKQRMEKKMRKGGTDEAEGRWKEQN